LVRVEAQQRQAIDAVVTAAVVAEVRDFGGWYSSPDITKFAGRLAKLVRAGQRQTASSTESYATRILALLLGRRPTPPGVIRVGDLRGGVPLESVYGRLADQYRYLYASRGPGAVLEGGVEPLTDLEILNRLVDRAEVQTGDNLGLAMRDQWAAEIEAAPVQVTGFRRVIHPELVAEGSTSPGPVCGLCAVVSTRLFLRGDLLPLHARCRCSVSPVVGDADGDGDPGSALNKADLARVYKEAGSTGAADLKRTKIRIVDHAELGPRLVFDGHEVRTAAEAVRADEVPAAL
jgi:hypothetical protein